MVRLRNKKVEVVSKEIPDIVPYGDESGDVLVVGWGSTFGAIRSAVEKARNEKKSVSHIQLRYLNPLPSNLGDILLKFEKIIVPPILTICAAADNPLTVWYKFWSKGYPELVVITMSYSFSTGLITIRFDVSQAAL